MRIALSIAGSDPTGGAGLQADLQVFRSFGVHGAGVPTALTVQDSRKVHQVCPVFPSLLLDQLRVLLADLAPHAVKIGMLATDDLVRNVTLALSRLAPGTPVVIDPVLRASDGSPLLERRALPALQALMRGCTLVTPNLLEAQELTEVDAHSRSGRERAARVFLTDLGVEGVLIKGGHAEGAPSDLLGTTGSDGPVLRWLEGERIEAGSIHGTGCALSSAVAAGLALGHSLERAVDDARRFVADAIRAASRPGAGAGLLGFGGGAR